jgi:tetratricopeptide (TPR) repeat protein
MNGGRATLCPTILDIAQERRFPWVWIYAFTALVLGIAVAVFAGLAFQSHREAGLGRTANATPPPLRQIPAERIELLARIEPPAYQPAADDAKKSRQFRAAMDRYWQHDYTGAIAGLRAMLHSEPRSMEARFYLAVCLLLERDRSEGIQELQGVISAGNTPFLEAAHFYLAKALLGDRNIDGAAEELRKVVEMQGNLEKQAQVLRAQIVPSR